MKPITTVIVFSTTLVLAACSQSNSPDTADTTDAQDAVTEQNISTLSEPQSIPSDQAAFEAGSSIQESGDEAGSTMDNMAGEATEGTNKD